MVFSSKAYIIPVDKYLLNNCTNNRLSYKGIISTFTLTTKQYKLELCIYHLYFDTKPR